MTEAVRRALSDLIADRIEDQMESSNSLRPGELAYKLSEIAGLDSAQAIRLLSADEVEISDEQIHSIALGLEIHEDVLRCLLAPTSPEISAHVLKNVVSPSLNPEGCAFCDAISIKIHSIDLLDQEEISGLLLAVLEHLAVQSSPGDCEEEVMVESGLSEQLLSVFDSLPSDAQMRVMAAAYNEAGGRPILNPLGGMHALLSECDSKLLLRALDKLAENGTMVESELASQIGVNDAGALQHLTSIWESSLAKIEDLGYHLDPRSLSVTLSSEGERMYSLSSEPAKAWRAIGLANEALSWG